MAKTHTTVLAEHEIRLNQIEGILPELALTLKSIDKKLDENYVARREYDKHIKDQTKYNKGVEKELSEIKDTMMTKDEFESFSRSQFWQKVLTFLGGAGATILVTLAIQALA